MLVSRTYRLETRTDQGWISAQSTVEEILGRPQSQFFTTELAGIGPGQEKRYPIQYLDQLPSGQYRVTVGTGDDKPKNALDNPKRLIFSR